MPAQMQGASLRRIKHHKQRSRNLVRKATAFIGDIASEEAVQYYLRDAKHISRWNPHQARHHPIQPLLVTFTIKAGDGDRQLTPSSYH